MAGMDLRTGRIHELKDGETLEELARRLGGEPRDFVELKNPPAAKCPKCGGKGYRKPGLFSRRFVPCECCKP